MIDPTKTRADLIQGVNSGRSSTLSPCMLVPNLSGDGEAEVEGGVGSVDLPVEGLV